VIRSKSDEPRGFLLSRQSSLWCKLVNDIRQLLTESTQHLLARHPGKPCQRIDPVRAECSRQVIRGDRLMRPGSNPRLCDITLAILLELLEQIVQASAYYASSSAASE